MGNSDSCIRINMHKWLFSWLVKRLFKPMMVGSAKVPVGRLLGPKWSRQWSRHLGVHDLHLRECAQCGRTFVFQSYPNGTWKRSCWLCEYSEEGTGFVGQEGCPCCGKKGFDRTFRPDRVKIECTTCGYWTIKFADVEEAAPDSKGDCCGADRKCC